MLVAFVSPIVPLALALALPITLPLPLPLTVTVTIRGSKRDGRSVFIMNTMAGKSAVATGRSQANSVRGPAVRGYVR